MYTVQLTQDQGFHPKLLVHYSSSIPSSVCPLYLLLEHIPPSFILDRFQLFSLFASSSAMLVIEGERDLEVAMNENLNTTSLILQLPQQTLPHSLEIPMHVRYQLPVHGRWLGSRRLDTIRVHLDAIPVLFYACNSDLDSASINLLPPPCPISSLSTTLSSNLDFESLFPRMTTVHFLPPIYNCSPLSSTSKLTPLSVEIPTGVSSDLILVEYINFFVVWSAVIGLFWTCRKMQLRWNTSEKRAKVC